MTDNAERQGTPVKFDDAFAAEYDLNIRLSCPGYDALHEMLGVWLMNLPEHSHFLSVGAGTGAEILALRRRFAEWTFVALEPSSAMLDICRQRLVSVGMDDRVECINAKLDDYRPQKSFDAASCIFVSHFIRDSNEKLAFFKSIASALRIGGRLLTADLAGDRVTSEFDKLFDAWMTQLASNGIAEKELSEARSLKQKIPWTPEPDYLAIVEQAGFTRPVRFFQSFLWGGWVAERIR